MHRPSPPQAPLHSKKLYPGYSPSCIIPVHYKRHCTPRCFVQVTVRLASSKSTTSATAPQGASSRLPAVLHRPSPPQAPLHPKKLGFEVLCPACRPSTKLSTRTSFHVCAFSKFQFSVSFKIDQICFIQVLHSLQSKSTWSVANSTQPFSTSSRRQTAQHQPNPCGKWASSEPRTVDLGSFAPGIGTNKTDMVILHAGGAELVRKTVLGAILHSLLAATGGPRKPFSRQMGVQCSQKHQHGSLAHNSGTIVPIMIIVPAGVAAGDPKTTIGGVHIRVLGTIFDPVGHW